MNKLTKGAIAGAAGLTLLLGGGTTFALWNSSDQVAGGQITAGNLTVTADKTSDVWKVNGTTATIGKFKVVPGDVIEYTTTVDVIALGNNLTADLTIDDASIQPATPGNAADEALAARLTNTAEIASGGTSALGSSITGTSPTLTYTAGPEGIEDNVTVTVTMTFPSISGPSETSFMADPYDTEQAARTGMVNLEALTVSLKQNAQPQS